MTGAAIGGPAGGPGRSTYVINLLVITEAFGQLDFGLATAASFCLFLFVLIVTIVQLRLIRAEWEY
jgi:ABC-type sugar transport system permease subunit